MFMRVNLKCAHHSHRMFGCRSPFRLPLGMTIQPVGDNRVSLELIGAVFVY